MDIQNQIKRTLSQPEGLAYVSALLEAEGTSRERTWP